MRDGAGAAINRSAGDQPAEAALSPPAGGAAPRPGRKSPTIKPPPDAGDAWEPPEHPGDEQARRDREATAAFGAGRDALGHELPPHLKDAFADSFYEDVVTSLRWMARRVRGDPSLYVRLHTSPSNNPFAGEIAELAERAAGLLSYHRPHVVCPHCGGKEGGCARCYCCGWLSRGQFEEIVGL